MDYRHRIPIEIWDEVFWHFHEEDLRHIHLVDRLFHRLSSPLLFRAFHFLPSAPYDFSDGDSDSRSYDEFDSSWDAECDPPTPEKVTKVDNALTRLKIWSSPPIAPLVRSCIMTAPKPSDSRRLDHAAGSNPESGLPSLSDAFFDALPHFTHLREFSAVRVHFTQVDLTNICFLPNLTSLHTSSCIMDLVVPDPSPLTFNVRHFSSWENTFGTGAADQWVRALRPDRLQSLSTQRDLLPNIADLEYTFPHVDTLCFKGLDLSASDKIPRLLSKFPAVRILTAWRLRGSMGIGFKPDVEVSGLIRNYDGPYHLLRFLHLAPSSHLHITDLNFPDFISELGAIQRLDNVTSLVLDIEDYVTNLDGLGKSFPTLKELKICVEIGYQLDSFETIDKSKVLDSLKQLTRFSSFPLYLAKLEISWSGRDPSYARETNIIKPDDLRQLKDVLVLRHSALERLRLDCVDYTLFWGRTSEDGTECCMVYDPHDSSNLNVLYSDEFWDTYC